MRERLAAFFRFLLKPAIAFSVALIIAIVAIYVSWQSSMVVPSGSYTAAVMAPITAAGGTISDLSFQIPGQVASLPVALGQSVTSGETLMRLDQSSLLAAQAGAAANLEAAQAQLAALVAGTRPEQLAIDKTNVTQTQEALRNVIQNAYINADDAIHNKADQFFTNPRSASPTLSFVSSDQTLQNTIQTERVALEPILTAWGSDVNDVSFATSDPMESAQTAEANLTQVSAFLDTAAAILAKGASSSSLPLATLQGYQSSINTARLNIAGSTSAITSAITALQSAQGVLTLAEAGPTTHDVATLQAAVDAAQAALNGITVSLKESVLTSPITGTIVSLNAYIGQTVVPGQALVSVESLGGSKPNALVIPTSSVITDANQAFVYIKGDPGTPVKTPVTTGLVGTDGMTEITVGLTAGQEVLTFGTNK